MHSLIWMHLCCGGWKKQQHISVYVYIYFYLSIIYIFLSTICINLSAISIYLSAIYIYICYLYIYSYSYQYIFIYMCLCICREGGERVGVCVRVCMSVHAICMTLRLNSYVVQRPKRSTYRRILHLEPRQTHAWIT